MKRNQLKKQLLIGASIMLVIYLYDYREFFIAGIVDGLKVYALK